MRIAPLHNGPISNYLAVTSKTHDQFEGELRAGNPAAASIFAAEQIVRAISDLMMTVEGLPLQRADTE